MKIFDKFYIASRRSGNLCLIVAWLDESSRAQEWGGKKSLTLRGMATLDITRNKSKTYAKATMKLFRIL